MWNSLNLKCPAADMVEYPSGELYAIDDLRGFVTILTTAAADLTSESPVWNEIKKFHDVQKRYNRMLCCDKCLVFLQRIGHYLKQLVLLNLSRSYLDLAERFLRGFQDNSDSLQLPSRQQIEYILIRTKTAAKLVSEAIIYSRDTFCFLVQKLKTKHLVPELLLATSITAKFNMLLKTTLRHLCAMYKEILPWKSKLLKGAFKWPEDLQLPPDLEKWLETFDSQLMKPFTMSKGDFNILSTALNISAEGSENDLNSFNLVTESSEDSCGSSYGQKKKNKKHKKNSSRESKSLVHKSKKKKLQKNHIP